MKCPNCGREVVEEATFCPYCRTELNKTNNEVLNDTANNNPKRKNNKILIFLLIIPIFIVATYFVYNKYKDLNKEKQPTKTEEVKEETKKYNSLEKIDNDYNNKLIDINEYFTQLVYLAFSSDNLDPKYTSDYNDYYVMDQFGFPEILEKHYNDLDKDIVDFYLDNQLMTNVHIGTKEIQVEKQSNNSKNYRVSKLKKKEKEEPPESIAINHYLDKAYLSKNGHFLLWYTRTGIDGITEEQVQNIANGLEDAIDIFYNTFGLKYSYKPYLEPNHLSEEWMRAIKVLNEHNINEQVLTTAMNVYIFDTGSDSTLATYSSPSLFEKLTNVVLHNLEFDGFLGYPFIRINTRGISNPDNLKEIYNHEFFHHLQYRYCDETANLLCQAGSNLTEGMANFASAITSDVSSSNNFLNGWADFYIRNTSEKLRTMHQNNKNGNPVYGYPLYLYFYSYYKNVNNAISILMSAHNEDDAITYIQNNTTKEELIKTINYLSEKNLNQDYELNTLLSNDEVVLKDTIKKGKKDYIITAGSIDYFKITNKNKIEVKTDSDYVTIKLYGNKDNKFEELKSTTNEFEFESKDYSEYKTIYLVLTNANLLEDYNYSINIIRNDETDDGNSEYETSFNNYNIEIEMTTKTSGIELTQHSKGVVDELHQKEYLETEMNTMGIPITTKTYSDFETGYSYTSQPMSDDVWLKDKSASQMVDLKVILEKLKSNKNVEKISEDHFKVKMDKKDMQAMMKQANSNSSALSGDVEIEVYTENDYITKLEYDFTDMIKGFDLFKATITFSNYNNAGDVEIPASVINSAK